jgi:hypothetical protein
MTTPKFMSDLEKLLARTVQEPFPRNMASNTTPFKLGVEVMLETQVHDSLAT